MNVQFKNITKMKPKLKGIKKDTVCCDICTAPMELTNLIMCKDSGKPYRQRWFKCPVCGHQKMIFSNGEIKVRREYGIKKISISL
jgi:hypothetical protein